MEIERFVNYITFDPLPPELLEAIELAVKKYEAKMNKRTNNPRQQKPYYRKERW